MPDGLLATKFHIPRPRAGLVLRARLARLIDSGASRRLTLISAPAGSGKTTAVSEWVNGSDLATAWLSLDEGDNDPVRFWGYFVGALQTLEGGLGESASSLLSSPQQPSTESFMTVLINETTSFDKEFAIVLEDYHAIDNEGIHEGIAFLLEHLPPQMHIVIITRADPPLPLARLRARDDLTEVRAGDLRFTEDETGIYLKQAVGRDFSTADVAALESRTEGWIVGLQMAALSMQDREDVAEFIESLTGSHRFILDYLAEEVLHRQSEQIQSFLLQTSILSRLAGPLCDAVTGGTGGRDTLAMLDRANLFVLPLDDEREWYRYHHLFAQFLRSLLEETPAKPISELHGRASDWFAKNGFAAEAVRHAQDAEDFEKAADLVEQSADTAIWRDSQHMTVLAWMDSLPPEVVASRPRLCISHAWARFLTGQWETVEPLLQQAEHIVGEMDDDSSRQRVLGEAATIRSGIAYETGEMERSIELAKKSLALLPSEAQAIRSVAAFALGLGHFFAGDLPAAGEAYAEATALSRETHNVSVALLSIGCQVQLRVAQGRLRAAADQYHQALKLGAVKAGPSLPPTGLACVHMGEVLREWNDLEAAERVLREGISLSTQQGSMPEHVLTGYVSLARVLDARGDQQGALSSMEQAENLLAELLSRPGDVASIISQAMGYRVRWWLARHDLAAADSWIEKQPLDGNGTLDPTRLVDHILLARCLIYQHRFDEALSVLNRLLGPAEAGGRMGSLAEILVLKAMVTYERAGDAEATKLLDRALSLAEPEGYVRLFLDEGEPMHRLLQSAAKGGTRDYATQLLAAFRSEIDEMAEGLVDRLNDREMAILRFMSAGLSNRDIAEQLFLSVNTVKWHARNIYGKLGVSNRSMAVARARDLNLL